MRVACNVQRAADDTGRASPPLPRLHPSVAPAAAVWRDGAVRRANRYADLLLDGGEMLRDVSVPFVVHAQAPPATSKPGLGAPITLQNKWDRARKTKPLHH
jgi:hypothetical protein